MMLNVDHEAFVSASGSIACESLPPELQKEYEEGQCKVNNRQLRFCEIYLHGFGHSGFSVVAQTRRTAQGNQKPLPTSGDAFWQIEKLSNPLSGERKRESLLM